METITTELVDRGEKRDARGRRIIAAPERAALMAAYRVSGLTQREFAQREGVKYYAFVKWLARNRPRQRQQTTFAEVATGAVRAGSAMEVALPNGVVVRGGDVEQLVALVERLRRC